MSELENFIVLDKNELTKQIEKLKLLRNKAIEENSYETAQWISGKIESIKVLIMNSFKLEPILRDTFDRGWEKCGEYNSNYTDCIESYLKEFTIKQTNETEG
jgi:hypothetical protein